MEPSLVQQRSSPRLDVPLEAVAETAADAVVVASEDGVVAYANPAAERLFGYDPGRLEGLPLTALMPERFRDAHTRGLRRSSETGESTMIGTTTELFALRGDGVEVPVELSLTAGEVDGRRYFAGVMRDISARLAAQDALAKSESLLAQAQQVAGVGSWEWDVVEDVVSWSDELYRIYGLEPRAFAASFAAFVERVHPDDRERVVATIQDAMERIADATFEHRIVRPDGEVRELHCRAECVTDQDGRLVRMFGIGQDVTDRQRRDRALREAEALFRGAFERAPIGMALTRPDGRFAQVNGALCEMLGYPEEELTGKTFAEITHPEDVDGDLEAAREMVAGERDTYHAEKRYIHAHGHEVWIALSVALVRDTTGAPLYFVSQMMDITERRRIERKLRHLADHDPLTGLYNRRRFEQELERQVAYAARYRPAGAVLLLDLDNFKYVNDTLGHRVGDELIKGVAGVMRERLRSSDVLARLGGDEFAVVLAEVGRDEAAAAAEGLRRAIADHPMTVEGRTVCATASVGVTLIDERGVPADRLIGESDLAMYAAKHAGRDRVAFYEPGGDDHSLIRSGFTWSARLRDAIEHDRFVLHAQPIVEVASGETTRHELLIRMVGEDGSLVPPATFLSTAERFGFIESIDRWVVGEAIDLLATRPDLTLEVNLSGKSIGSRALLEAIGRRLRETGADPSRLIFEVTETAAITNMEAARDFARALRQLGCKFALDDFGAGFGSFVYLKRLPVDYVKLDGDFIRGLPDSHTDRLLVRAMVDVARGLGQRTIAEFVGSEACFRLLGELGVDYAQGFWLGMPGPLDELPAPAA